MGNREGWREGQRQGRDSGTLNKDLDVPRAIS